MDNQTAPLRSLPNVRFRVLIVGRANAGKTSILQRVCDTTESPKIYRVNGQRKTEIHLDPTAERGLHKISDELEFINHTGYVFHDSCGFECGNPSELKTVQEFVRERCQSKTLGKRLHVIWYCIPMDNNRPCLDIESFDKICPDKNVPVIAVFTKFEAFKHRIRVDLKDNRKKENHGMGRVNVEDECERMFKAQYLSQIGESHKFVRLEGMEKAGAHCNNLIETTISALNPATVALMLLAVQTKNLELSVLYAVKGIMDKFPPKERDTENMAKRSLVAFPAFWWWEESSSSLELELLSSELFLSSSFFEETRALFQSLVNFTQDLLPQNDPEKLPKTFSNAPTIFIMIAQVLVLRYATLIHAQSNITKESALDKAYAKYLGSNWGTKVNAWLAASAHTVDGIIVFINSIPWDLVSS